MPSHPWATEKGVRAVVEHWLASGRVKSCLAAERVLGANSPSVRPIPESIGPALRAALAGRGIRELYSHQLEALEAALARRHVVVATPTASGKSLCFHLPVLQALSEDPTSSAI